jgi:hypothetical protein
MMEPSVDRYTQGLWENDLGKGLLWFVIDPQPLKKEDLVRTTGVNASSWSWISVMGRHVEYPLAFYRPRATSPSNNKLRLNKPSREPSTRCLHHDTSYLEPIPVTLKIYGYLRKAKMRKCKAYVSSCDLADTDDTVRVRLGTMRCNTQADLEEDREV